MHSRAYVSAQLHGARIIVTPAELLTWLVEVSLLEGVEEVEKGMSRDLKG